MAKRRVIVRRKYVPPKLPDKPKVTLGPKSYGRTKKGRYICIRFFVSKWRAGRWYVVDLDNEEWTYYAQGTSPKGYSSQEKAIEVARKYRDEYGAWSVVPF